MESLNNDPVCIYHQLTWDDWTRAQKHGLRTQSRGAKGNEASIQATDDFLDTHTPESLREIGLSRNNNLYGFIGNSHSLITIATGESLPVREKAAEPGQVLLELSVDPTRCWVSDLDLYDSVMNKRKAPHKAADLAREYWSHLQRLDQYDGSILRPEVMITYDVPVSDIRKVASE